MASLSISHHGNDVIKTQEKKNTVICADKDKYVSNFKKFLESRFELWDIDETEAGMLDE